MHIFDSHCHLDDRVFEPDFQEVLDRAAESQVQRMLVVGIDLDTSHRAVALAKNHAGLYASVGIHPHDVDHHRLVAETDRVLAAFLRKRTPFLLGDLIPPT